jgi:hypothetical protein
VVFFITLENCIIYSCLNTNNININENMVLDLFTMLYQLFCLCNIGKMRL